MKINNNINLIDLKKEAPLFEKDVLLKVSNLIKDADFILREDTLLFEKRFSEYIWCKYWVWVKSWTAALYLSLIALWIWKWDEVITTPFTFNATIEAIVYTWAKPVFCDVKIEDWNIDEKKIEKLITKNTKGVLPVHLYWNSCNNNIISDICKRNNLFFIEDACQAHWSIYNWNKLGSFWDVSCFSFMPAKVLWAYWDAWIVLTNDKNIYDKIIKLRDHWRTEKYLHTYLWFNERIDNIQSAILNIKINKLDDFITKRRSVAKQYKEYITFDTFFEKDNLNNNNFYVYPIKVKNRLKLVEILKEKWISTGIYYPIPNHLQPVFRYLWYKKWDFPHAELLSDITLAIPMHPFLLDTEIEYIIKEINNLSKYAY